MMMSFEKALKDTLGFEGGYSDDKRDSGGKTNFGITEKVARANGYKGDMKDLPSSVASKIYRKEYWDRYNLDKVCNLSSKIAHKLFDMGVNIGTRKVCTWFQVILTSFNRETLFNDLKLDGKLGDNSLSALKIILANKQDEKLLIEALKSRQGYHYYKLAYDHPKNRAYTRGWLKRL